MSETTVAVAEDLPAEPAPTPSEWPLAEEILAAHPRLHMALGDGDDLIILSPDVEVADLPLTHLIAPPVILRDEDHAAFAASLITIDEEIEKALGENVSDSAAALKRATENLWPVSAHYSPLQLIPGEEVRQQHQQASVTDLRRWAPDKSLDDDPETDRAATRFIAAFDADPEGDEDRAPLPAAEVHHDTGGQC